MATLSELRSWIESYQRMVNNCDNQIARLNEVYKELGKIKELFRSTRSHTKDFFNEKGVWRGETHTSFCRAGDELDSVFGEYYKQLDAAQDAVNTKKAQLKAKKWELIPFINGWVAQIQEMKANVDNALN